MKKTKEIKNNEKNLNEKKVKVKKEKDPKKKFSYLFKKWFFGIGKEFGRITWPSKFRIFKDLLIVLIITMVIALIFLGIDQISALI